MDTPAVAPFRAASEFFVDVVAALPSQRYEEQWSDEWRVLDLVAHGNRANTLPVEYFERPVPVAGPEYLLPENIAARGRQAVRDLGDDPVAAVRAASERVLTMVAAVPDDARVGTPFGEVPLDRFLRSRVAELVLHGLDLSTDIEPPSIALETCCTFLVDRAVGAGLGVDVALALSGRGTLPAGFSVL